MKALMTRTVLIIEDSPEDRATYKRYLAGAPDYHYELVEAKLGAEGIALWRAHHPDCVLLNYRLPDSDGLNLLRAIVAEGGTDACAIVMLTSMVHTQTAVEALKIGAHDYADKSDMSASMLLNAINNAIEKATLRRQLEEQRQRLSRYRHARLLATLVGRPNHYWLHRPLASHSQAQHPIRFHPTPSPIGPPDLFSCGGFARSPYRSRW